MRARAPGSLRSRKRGRGSAPGRHEPDAVAEVIRSCPTGALLYEVSGGPAEEPDAEVTVTPAKDGPLFVRGRVDLTDPRGNGVAVGTTFRALPLRRLRQQAVL